MAEYSKRKCCEFEIQAQNTRWNANKAGIAQNTIKVAKWGTTKRLKILWCQELFLVVKKPDIH